MQTTCCTEAVTVLVIITIDFGGFSWIPTEWPDDWKTSHFSGRPTTRVSWFGSILPASSGTATLVVINYRATSMATKDATAPAMRLFGSSESVLLLVLRLFRRHCLNGTLQED